MADSGKCVAGCTICCLIFIPSIFLFAFSFGVVEVLRQAILLDEQVMRVEYESLYLPGRHWTGLNRYFIDFPTDVQTIRFGKFSWFDSPEGEEPVEDDIDRGDIECRAKDGMQVFMEVTFQYLISNDAKDLVRLYRDFGNEATGGGCSGEGYSCPGYREFYADVAEKVIRDVASQFKSVEFFTKRAILEDEMRRALDEDLRRSYASVASLQLVNMEFDRAGEFSEAIENTQIANQDVQQQRNEVEVAIVKGMAEYESAARTAAVTVRMAEADKDVIVKKAQADAEVILYKAQMQIEGYNRLKVDLGLNTTAQLMTHLWMQAVNNDVKQVVMGMAYPKVLENLIAPTP